jgi:spore maturation protein SpmA
MAKAMKAMKALKAMKAQKDEPPKAMKTMRKRCSYYDNSLTVSCYTLVAVSVETVCVKCGLPHCRHHIDAETMVCTNCSVKAAQAEAILDRMRLLDHVSNEETEENYYEGLRIQQEKSYDRL